MSAWLLSFWFLGGQPEQPFYKSDLRSNIIAPHPSNLPLSDHVHRLISLNCSLGCVEFSEALLGLDPRKFRNHGQPIGRPSCSVNFREVTILTHSSDWLLCHGRLDETSVCWDSLEASQPL